MRRKEALGEKLNRDGNRGFRQREGGVDYEGRNTLRTFIIVGGEVLAVLG